MLRFISGPPTRSFNLIRITSLSFSRSVLEQRCVCVCYCCSVCLCFVLTEKTTRTPTTTATTPWRPPWTEIRLCWEVRTTTKRPRGHRTTRPRARLYSSALTAVYRACTAWLRRRGPAPSRYRAAQTRCTITTLCTMTPYWTLCLLTWWTSALKEKHHVTWINSSHFLFFTFFFFFFFWISDSSSRWTDESKPRTREHAATTTVMSQQFSPPFLPEHPLLPPNRTEPNRAQFPGFCQEQRPLKSHLCPFVLTLILGDEQTWGGDCKKKKKKKKVRKGRKTTTWNSIRFILRRLNSCHYNDVILEVDKYERRRRDICFFPLPFFFSLSLSLGFSEEEDWTGGHG